MGQEFLQDVNQNDLLIERAQQAAEGVISFDELMDSIEDRQEQLNLLRQDFNNTVSKEDEFIRELLRETIQNVDLSFDDYSRILEEMMSCAAEFNNKGVADLLEILAEAYDTLNMTFIGYRNDVLIARGPTTHPGLNLLITHILLIKEGIQAENDLFRDLEIEKISTEGSLDLLKQHESNFFNDNMKIFYEKYSTLLKSFDEFFDLLKKHEDNQHQDREMTEEEAKLVEELETKIKEKLEQMQKSLEELGGEYKKIDVDFYYVSYSYEPTSMPMLNLVINSGWDNIEGKCEKGMFQYFLDEFLQVFSSVKYSIDSIAVSANPSTESEKEETKRVAEDLNNMEEALNGLYTFLENDDLGLFKKSMDTLIAAAEEYEKSLMFLQNLEKDSGKVTCFRCGFKNIAGKMTCVKCRALLPMVEQPKIASQIDFREGQEVSAETYPAGPQMTVYVKNLFDSAQGLVDGSVEIQAFETIIKQMEARLKNAYKQGKDIPRITPEIEKELGKEKAENMLKLLTEASTDYNEGLEFFAKGLEQFKYFMNNISLENLEIAKETIWKGVTRLQKSMKIIEKEFQTKTPA